MFAFLNGKVNFDFCLNLFLINKNKNKMLKKIWLLLFKKENE